MIIVSFTDIRSKEKKLLVKLLFMTAVNMSMALLLSSIAPVATFAAHIAFGNDLSVSDVSIYKHQMAIL